jgi:hypothetical protein
VIALRDGRGPVLFAALALTAVAASAAASAALSEPPDVPAAEQMRDEIEAMIESGVSPRDPKVRMLEREAAEIEAGATASPTPDPGGDVSGLIAEARAEDAAEDAGHSRTASVAAGAAHDDDRSAWESGVVQCEAVPGLLSADAIAGATCVSVPQPDGTNRYVAVAPDGTMRIVAFGHDGAVRRVADASVGAAVPAPAVVEATPEGDLLVTPPGGGPVSVDLP